MKIIRASEELELFFSEIEKIAENDDLWEEGFGEDYSGEFHQEIVSVGLKEIVEERGGNLFLLGTNRFFLGTEEEARSRLVEVERRAKLKSFK